MPRQTKEEKFASILPETLAYHSKILSDGPRVDALRRAVEMYVRPSTRFLDVGSGTGVWAILAAKLGAARVTAVEMEESLIPVIYKLAQENGVADRVEIIHGNIDDVILDERFDVIVGELFADDVFGAKTTNSMMRIRDRFLADGGIIIPQHIRLFAAPTAPHTVETNLSVTTGFLNGLMVNYPQAASENERMTEENIAEPRLLMDIDYMTVTEAPKVEPLTAEWELPDVSRVGAFRVFCTLQYAPGVELDSTGSKTWTVLKHGFTPFEVKEGVIKFTAMFEPHGSRWSVSLPSHPAIPERNYSPVFGYTRVKMALAGTPFRKIRRRKQSSGE